MHKLLKKKIVLFCGLLVVLSGCGINRQTQQIKALEDCKYRIVGAQQIFISGTDVQKVIDQRNIDLSSLPGVAVGLLTKDIPFKASINLEISNPTANIAAINQFEYLLLIGEKEIANGLVDRAVTVNPGQKIVIPVQVNSNLYNLLSDKTILNGVMQAIKQRTGTESLGALTIKLKPTFLIGKTSFKYPGYITITKEINSGLFM